MGTKWEPEPEVRQEWDQSGDKVVTRTRKSDKNGNKVARKWDKIGNKVGIKWEQKPQSGTRMGNKAGTRTPKWDKNGNKAGTKWEQEPKSGEVECAFRDEAADRSRRPFFENGIFTLLIFHFFF